MPVIMPIATTGSSWDLDPLDLSGPMGSLHNTSGVSNVTLEPLPFSTGDIAWVATLMIGIFIVNLVGNICAIIAFCKDQKLQTVSNYYVFNLALSDLMLGVLSMPVFGVYMSYHFQWPFGNNLCKAWLVMDYMACVETILTIIMISHDRYLLVSQGLDYGKSQTYHRALAKIAVSWVLSFLLFGPSVIFYDVWRGYSVVESNWCVPEYHNVFLFNLVGAVMEFMLPFVLISCLNLGLYLSIRKRVRKRAHLMAMNMFQSKQSLVQPSVSINSNNSEVQSPQTPKENLEFPSPMRRAKSELEKVDKDGTKTPKLRRSRSTNSLSNFAQRGESWRTRSIRKARSFRRSLRRPMRSKDEAQDPVTIVITAYESREDVQPDTENDPYYGLRLSWSTSCLYSDEAWLNEEFQDPDSPRDELNFDPTKLRECWEESLGIKNTKYSRSTSDVPDSCSQPIDISKWFTPKTDKNTANASDDSTAKQNDESPDETTEIILKVPVKAIPNKVQEKETVPETPPLSAQPKNDNIVEIPPFLAQPKKDVIIKTPPVMIPPIKDLANETQTDLAQPNNETDPAEPKKHNVLVAPTPLGQPKTNTVIKNPPLFIPQKKDIGSEPVSFFIEPKEDAIIETTPLLDDSKKDPSNMTPLHMKQPSSGKQSLGNTTKCSKFKFDVDNCVDSVQNTKEKTPITCTNHDSVFSSKKSELLREKRESSESLSKSPPIKSNGNPVFQLGETETDPEKVPLLKDASHCNTDKDIMNSINSISTSNVGINESAEAIHELPNVKNKKLPSSPLPTRASSLKVAGEKISEMPPEVVIPSRPKLPASPLPVRAQSLKVPGEKERVNGNNNVKSQPTSDSALKSTTATEQKPKEDLKTRRSVSFYDLDEVGEPIKTPETSPNPSPTSKLKPACKASVTSIGSHTPDTPTKSVSFRDLESTGNSGSRRGSVVSVGSPKRRSSIIRLGEIAMALRKGKINHTVDNKKKLDEKVKEDNRIDKATLDDLNNKLHKTLSLKETSRSGSTTPTLRHSTSMISIPDSNYLLAVPIRRSRSLKTPTKKSSLKLSRSATSIEKVHLLESNKNEDKQDRLTKSASCLTAMCTDSQSPTTDSGSGSASGSVKNEVPAPSPVLSKKSMDNKSFSSIASSPGSNRSAGSMGSYISNTSFTSLGLHTLKHFLQVNGENVQALTKILQRDRRAARSLLLLVVVFVLCWAPFTVVTIMSSSCLKCISQGMRTAACCLVWLNASLNPFLYAYTSHRYRAHFQRLLCPYLAKHRTPAAFHSSLRTKDTQNM